MFISSGCESSYDGGGIAGDPGRSIAIAVSCVLCTSEDSHRQSFREDSNVNYYIVYEWEMSVDLITI